MEYQIELEVFQGPFDLLLHLIEKDEIDIYNIPIAVITAKYLEYLSTIQLLNFEGVGDFLVMAATLMQIKAKLLLPRADRSEAAEAEEAEEEDPRWELVCKLIEYKKIKEAALSLQAIENRRQQVYTRVGGEFPDRNFAAAEDSLKNLSVWDLMDAFKDILESLEAKLLKAAIPQPEISIRQRMTEIIDLLVLKKQVSFKKIFKEIDSRIGLITCFLAVLELIRLRKMLAVQTAAFEDIILILPEKVGSTA